MGQLPGLGCFVTPMANQMELIRKMEHGTGSELLREAWRQYFETRYSLFNASRPSAPQGSAAWGPT